MMDEKRKIRKPKIKKLVLSATAGVAATIMLMSSTVLANETNNFKNNTKSYISISARDSETDELMCPPEDKFVEIMLNAEGDVDGNFKKNFQDETRCRVIWKKCVEYNVNPMLCVAQAGIESNFGESDIALINNNYWGIGASDNYFGKSEEGKINAEVNAAYFPDFFSAVEGYAINISKKYVEFTDKDKKEEMELYIYGNGDFEGYNSMDSSVTMGSLKGMVAVYAPLWVANTKDEKQFKQGTVYSDGTYQDILKMLVKQEYLEDFEPDFDAEITPEQGLAYLNYYAETLDKYLVMIYGKECVDWYRVDNVRARADARLRKRLRLKEELLDPTRSKTVNPNRPEENNVKITKLKEGLMDLTLEEIEDQKDELEDDETISAYKNQEDFTVDNQDFDWEVFLSKYIMSQSQKN